MSSKEDELINTLIYLNPQRKHPTRYEAIRYSTWRIYMFQELEQYMSNDKQKQLNSNIPNLLSSLFKQDNKQFYQFVVTPGYLVNSLDLARQDSISHFICRMLYSQNQRHRQDFVNFQKMILQIRLNSLKNSKTLYMPRLKSMLSSLLQGVDLNLNVSEEEWNEWKHKIIQATICDHKQKKQLTSADFAKIPFDLAESGIRKRKCFIRRGYVYAPSEVLTDIVAWQYADYLKAKLEKTEKQVAEILQHDSQNQLTTFFLTTLNTMNQASLQQTEIEGSQKLSLKNVQVVWQKYFPPCMRQLTQAVKQKGHLRHDGRRQLWLFFKACGMSSFDNQEYFRRAMGHKVSDSQMKSHIYNIQHAYGQVGKKQSQHSKNCRNIITGPAPKKDQFHGCPFKHWNSGDLRQYLRRNYRVSEDKLNKVMEQKEANHFQSACGSLFQASEVNQKLRQIPGEVLNMLGKSPQSYFQAGMEINRRVTKKNENANKLDIQF